MGVGSRQTFTATLPPGQFHCLLDELPLHLIPQRQFGSQAGWRKFTHQQLFLNPQCSVLTDGQVPAELEPHRQLLEELQPAGNGGLGAGTRPPALCIRTGWGPGWKRRFRVFAPANRCPRPFLQTCASYWRAPAF